MFPRAAAAPSSYGSAMNPGTVDNDYDYHDVILAVTRHRHASPLPRPDRGSGRQAAGRTRAAVVDTPGYEMPTILGGARAAGSSSAGTRAAAAGTRRGDATIHAANAANAAVPQAPSARPDGQQVPWIVLDTPGYEMPTIVPPRQPADALETAAQTRALLRAGPGSAAAEPSRGGGRHTLGTRPGLRISRDGQGLQVRSPR